MRPPFPLRENPVAGQQWIRFLRLGSRWWALLVLVWLPATWFLRFKLGDFMMANVTAGTWPIANSFALLFLNFIVRADVPLIVLTYALMVPADEWRLVRTELMATFLRPREILEGLVFVPFLLLFLFNAIGAPFFYADLYDSVGPDCPSRAWAWAFAGTLGVAAFLEDLLFGAICLLALIQERLRGGGHSPAGLAVAGLVILRAGLLVGLLAISQMVMEAMMASLTEWAATVSGAGFLFSLLAGLNNDFARLFVTHVISMALVLAYEVRVIRALWTESLRQLESWVDASDEQK